MWVPHSHPISCSNVFLPLPPQHALSFSNSKYWRSEVLQQRKGFLFNTSAFTLVCPPSFDCSSESPRPPTLCLCWVGRPLKFIVDILNQGSLLESQKRKKAQRSLLITVKSSYCQQSPPSGESYYSSQG